MGLDELVASGRVERDVPTNAWTTYKVGGPAAYYLGDATLSDLHEITPLALPVLVIGKGSNLVIADTGFAGLVIRLGREFGEHEVRHDGTVYAGAAVALPVLARTAAKHGRGGLEWMVGVPGSVGGAVRMNAGCFGSDIAGSMIFADVLDLGSGTVRQATPESLDMRYRHTNVEHTDLVIGASFATDPIEPSAAEQAMRTITRWRRDHQPGGTYNAGSVFKNPAGDHAGRIIDELGLKGTAVGGASVSEKHANFFVADDGATAQDIYDLMQLVQRSVQDAAGVMLEPEIRFVGFDRA